MSKVYGVIAIKGGVGKTTAVANLGAVLANDFKKKVLLVDANFSAPNLGLHLGITNAKKTLHDVLLENCKIEKAVLSTGYGFDFLPADLRGSGKIKHFQLKQYVDKIKNNYDVVLIDSSPNLNHEMLAVMIASDELLVVTTPDYPTLSCTMHAVKIAKRRRTPITGLILNRVYNKKFELTIADVEEAAETPVLALLPHEINFMESLSMTKPAALHAPKTEAVVEYKKLAGALVGENFKDQRLKAKLERLLRIKKSKQEENRAVLMQK
ncbi:AAA family ATPase [Candidatus Woesearchaeota archaeon]|nr:AAA family ATPase [Candidatus Woesearchaeota archaeon]